MGERRLRIVSLIVAFLLGFSAMLLCQHFCPAAEAVTPTDAEKQRLQRVNETLGTNYLWSDEAWKTARSEAAYWESVNSLGHRRGFYCYGHWGQPDNCANGWLGSTAHRTGIQRDFRSGMTHGAVATVGTRSYFCPIRVETKNEETAATTTRASERANEPLSVEIDKPSPHTYKKTQRGFLRRLFR